MHSRDMAGEGSLDVPGSLKALNKLQNDGAEKVETLERPSSISEFPVGITFTLPN